MPKVSRQHLDARRAQIIAGARTCFAEFGYEGATVRRLETTIGLSRGAIFHHFADKETLFLAVASADAEAMIAVIADHGLVQVMRDMVHGDAAGERAGWLGTQLEVSRRVRTDRVFAQRWAEPSAALGIATRDRLQRQRQAGVLRADIPLDVLQRFLELAHDGLVLHLVMGQPADDLEPVLDMIEAAVRRPASDQA